MPSKSRTTIANCSENVTMPCKRTHTNCCKRRADGNGHVIRTIIQVNTSRKDFTGSGHHFHIASLHSPSGTYYQITRFIQGYVDNEVNLNPDASCSRTCDDYTRTRNYDCQPGTLCGEQHIDRESTRCNGTVLNCDFIDDDLTACPVSV